MAKKTIKKAAKKATKPVVKVRKAAAKNTGKVAKTVNITAETVNVAAPTTQQAPQVQNKGANMKTVIVKVSGGAPKEVAAETLGELKKAVDCAGYQATINGQPENSDNYQLKQDQVVVLTAQVKGA